jgi:RNA-binding protein NOB1
MSSIQSHRCKNLVLDAGPFLALSPIRGLAETYYTVPQVLAELKDRHTREYFEKLGSNAGIKIEVKEPPASALSHGTTPLCTCV